MEATGPLRVFPVFTSLIASAQSISMSTDSSISSFAVTVPPTYCIFLSPERNRKSFMFNFFFSQWKLFFCQFPVHVRHHQEIYLDPSCGEGQVMTRRFSDNHMLRSVSSSGSLSLILPPLFQCLVNSCLVDQGCHFGTPLPLTTMRIVSVSWGNFGH